MRWHKHNHEAISGQNPEHRPRGLFLSYLDRQWKLASVQWWCLPIQQILLYVNIPMINSQSVFNLGAELEKERRAQNKLNSRIREFLTQVALLPSANEVEER